MKERCVEEYIVRNKSQLICTGKHCGQRRQKSRLVDRLMSNGDFKAENEATV